MNTELLNKAFFPILFTTLYIFLYLGRRKIFKLLKKKVKNKDQIKVIKLLASNFKFKIDNYWLTIIFPIILTLILDIPLMILLLKISTKSQEPLWFQLIVRSFLNPISEEVTIRGFILGCFTTLFTLVEMLLKKKKLIRSFPTYSHKIWVVLMLIFQAFLFVISHENPTLFNWIVRLSSGFLYGLLYLAFKRNLLPPTIAHIAHNLIVTLGNL